MMRGRGSAILAFLVSLLAAASAHGANVSIFEVSNFASPPWSLTYFSGFTGTVGETSVWPAEMGWQGDQIDIAFSLPAETAESRQYRFRIVFDAHFDQEFDVEIYAGPSPANLSRVHSEFLDTARVISATIPLGVFTPAQTNWIRIRGVGVQVGNGQPAGAHWTRWTLRRTDVPAAVGDWKSGQLARGAYYLRDAIRANGMVIDSLPLSPDVDPFHPATPDAAGFALLGLCAADRLAIEPEAESLAELILTTYAGYTPGVVPDRNAVGMWWHWMDPNTGQPALGWGDAHTTIGSALLVGGALFAKNHFIDNAMIGALADELFATTNFDLAIHPSLDGRVYLAMTPAGGQMFGSVPPWNEYMIIVSLALRQPGATRAPAVAWRWLDPANAPRINYAGIPTLTDNLSGFAPAFWVHQQHFFNADFSTNADFEQFLENHRLADELYSAFSRGQRYRYGLTAGVNPSGYSADSISNYQGVFSPEAVSAWGQMDTLLEFLADQPPLSDPRLRYGLTRVSVANSAWIPFDAGLVDHLFLFFGLVEDVEPLFFRRRQPFQVDEDGDGIADAFDNCPGRRNRLQADGNGDGIGDACDCGEPFADLDRDLDVDLHDFAVLQSRWTDETLQESDFCLDRDSDELLGISDFASFVSCLNAGGPDLPAPVNCGP